MDGAAAPRRLAIWDPRALGPCAEARLLRWLAHPAPWDALQLRLHGAPLPSHLEGPLRQARARGLALWVNRDLELARALAAVGVQIGAADADRFTEARRLGLAVAVSVHTAAELDRWARRPVAFLLLGHLFATPSKPGRPPLGERRFAALARRAHPRPVVAIGGLAPGPRERRARRCGAWGIAAIRAAFPPIRPVTERSAR